MGRRETTSRTPGTNDYIITFHKEGETKKARSEGRPIMLLGVTREEAERQMWRAENLPNNRAAGKMCVLKIFTVKHGWKAVDDGDDDE